MCQGAAKQEGRAGSHPGPVMSREFEARVADEWRAKRDMCREICLTLKLQIETHSHQLLMEPTESLGDDSHEQWLKLEKKHSDDWAGNCWIPKGAPWHEEGDRPHGGLGRVRQCGASSGECEPKKVVIRSRWVKTKKGDEVRCSFDAQEFTARNPSNDFFAGTPPLYSAKTPSQLGSDDTPGDFQVNVHGRL